VSVRLKIEATRGSARTGRLVTPHGEVETPVFMPVGTLGSVKGVSQDVLEELGVEILLANTYHLYLRPGVETVRRMGGLHRFMSWERAILTDSGGFQVFSLNELRKVGEEGVSFRSHLDGSTHFLSPEKAMEVQIGLGADIIMAFDECTEYPAEAQRARDSMELTVRWAARCKKYFEEHKNEVPWNRSQVSGVRPQEEQVLRSPTPAGRSGLPGAPVAQDEDAQGSGSADHSEAELRSAGQPRAAVPRRAGETQSLFGQALFGIVQGGMDRELRRESAERSMEIGFPGYAIGGLSVGEPRSLTREIVESTLEHLPSDKPRYLMGVGTPEEIAQYAQLGVDMMDCVLPTRAARHGLLFTSEGKISIKQARYAQDEGALDPACECRVCRRYSRAYLRHLYASNELLAQVLNTVHNLHYYLATMRAVRAWTRAGDGTSAVK
jgi:queuine tRNA-ribosyltransferase